MTAPSPQLDPEQLRFALSIGGKIYGPYTAQQMRHYIAEGRITGSSLVSREGGAWIAASEDSFCANILNQRAKRVPAGAEPPAAPPETSAPPVIAEKSSISSASAREAFLKELEGVRSLRAPVAIAPTLRPVGPPRPAERSAAPSPTAARDEAIEASNFAIFFDLKSRGHNKLEEDIMSLGRAVRIMPGLWMLHATMTAGAIRNSLTKHFGTNDTFFIVDASRDKLAWFNVGPEIDSHIRQVWRRS